MLFLHNSSGENILSYGTLLLPPINPSQSLYVRVSCNIAIFTCFITKDTMPLMLQGVELVLWKDDGGSWRCAKDECPHRLEFYGTDQAQLKRVWVVIDQYINPATGNSRDVVYLCFFIIQQIIGITVILGFQRNL